MKKLLAIAVQLLALVGGSLLSLPAILHSACLPPEYDGPSTAMQLVAARQ